MHLGRKLHQKATNSIFRLVHLTTYLHNDCWTRRRYSDAMHIPCTSVRNDIDGVLYTYDSLHNVPHQKIVIIIMNVFSTYNNGLYIFDSMKYRYLYASCQSASVYLLSFIHVLRWQVINYNINLWRQQVYTKFI